MNARDDLGQVVRHRADVLDAVRGFAALLVASFHCREITWIGFQAAIAKYGFHPDLGVFIGYLSFPLVFGSIGVPLFFVLSGYVIHKRQAVLGPSKDFDSRRFYGRRILRIYPVLLGALVLTLVLDSIGRSYFGHPTEGRLDAATFFYNLVAMQGILAPPYGSDGPLWTLSLEIQFYAVYPIALILWRWAGPEIMMATVVAVSVVAWAVFRNSAIIFFAPYWASWWIGAWVADRQATGFNLGPLSSAICGGALVLCGCGVFLAGSAFFAFQLWAFGVAFLLFPLSTSSANNRAIVVLAFFGAFSFSLYAVHRPIIVFLTSAFWSGAKHDTMYVPIVVFVCTVFLAYLLSKIIEAPAVSTLRRT